MFLLALSMLFMNVNSSMFAKEETKAGTGSVEVIEGSKDTDPEITSTKEDALKEEKEKTPAEAEAQKTAPLLTDVKGRIYFDANKDHTFDEGEKGLPDMEVRLYKIEEGEAAKEAAYHTLTNIKGEYEIKGAEAGTYKVEYESVDSEKDLKDYTILQENKEDKERGEKEEQKLIEKNNKYIIAQEEIEIKEGSELELALYKKEAEKKEAPEASKEAGPAKQETNATKKTETNATKKTETNTKQKTETNTVKKTETNSEKKTEGNKQPVKKAEKTSKQMANKSEALMSPSQLNKLSSTKAGAAYARDSEFARALYETLDAEDWTFNAYYVGQNDKYHVEKTNDFSLKYQVEFHNSRDLEKGSVEIRIPAYLNNDRDKKGVLPSSIAVPQGTLEDPVGNKITPFNYYLDEETNELVFFNYEKITSGANIAFQVLYKDLEIICLLYTSPSPRD